MYTGSSISGYAPQNQWPYGYNAPTSQKVSVKKDTPSRITGLRSQINNLSETCNAKSENFSELNIYELLKLRECSVPCRNKAHHELIQRLNDGKIFLPHIGISRFVSEDLLNQIIEFFGEDCCSKIHHLNLTYTKSDFTLLKHFTGLKSLNLTNNNFQEFWVLDLMPNLEELIPSLEELKPNASTNGNYYG